MLIWMDAFRGDRFKCVVDANDTVGEVLERLREEICECCRSHVKRVSIDGVVLDEKRTPGSYNVQQWTTLRLSGGVLVKQRAASGAEYYVPWEENDKRGDFLAKTEANFMFVFDANGPSGSAGPLAPVAHSASGGRTEPEPEPPVRADRSQARADRSRSRSPAPK